VSPEGKGIDFTAMKFSEKLGITPVRNAIQGRELDEVTRIRLWNALHSYLPREGSAQSTDNWRHHFFRHIWSALFKQPIDKMGSEKDVRFFLRKMIISAPWYDVYDVVEFVMVNGGASSFAPIKTFRNMIQIILSEEMAGFRWITGEGFVEITDETEIAAIEDAIAAATPDRFAPVRVHLSKALSLLSDRREPDYSNSIKESILAVEAVAQILTGDPHATLGKALKLLRTKAPVHGAFESALKSLYGYTSDAEGIRHALSDEPTLDAADAKFMLVACSAFVVYMIQKALL
jgi:hypothetical protein